MCCNVCLYVRCVCSHCVCSGTNLEFRGHVSGAKLFIQPFHIFIYFRESVSSPNMHSKYQSLWDISTPSYHFSISEQWRHIDSLFQSLTLLKSTIPPYSPTPWRLLTILQCSLRVAFVVMLFFLSSVFFFKNSPLKSLVKAVYFQQTYEHILMKFSIKGRGSMLLILLVPASNILEALKSPFVNKCVKVDNEKTVTDTF